MAGFRIGEAFIEATVDDSQVGSGIQRALQQARSAASRDAQQLGHHLGQQIGDGMHDGASQGGRRAGQSGGGEFSGGFLASAGGALKSGVAGLAVAAGAVFTKGFAQALEQGNVTSKLQVQLGATPAEAKKYGQVAGSLYTHGITDTFEEGANAIKLVMQQGLLPPKATNAQIQSIAGKVTDLSKTFDMDLGGATNAVAQMMKTGLAKNAKEALDILTVGAQKGADKAGDLADTFNEYGTQFRKVGLDGKTAMGLLSQGLQAGARDADIVADSIKEFSIRAVDGSKTTAQGFQSLGLNADDMASRIARGGKSSSQALDLTLDKLRSIKDPAERSRIAVMLFGTQAEDMGDALYALDPSKAVDTLGKVGGAADKMGKTLHSGPSHQIEVFKRTLEQGVVNFIGGTVLPALMKFGSWIKTTFGPFFTAAKEAVSGFFSQFGGKAGAISGAKNALDGVGKTLRDAFNPVVAAAAKIWKNDLQPAVQKAATAFKKDMLPALNTMWGIVKNQVLPILAQLWSALQQALLPVLGKVASIIIGTVWPAIMKIYRAVAESLKPIFEALAKFVRNELAPRLKELGGKLSDLVAKMQPVISVVSTVITWLVKLAGKILATVIPPILTLTGKVLGGLIDIIIKVVGKIGTVIGWFVKFGQGVVDAVKKIKGGFDDMWSKVKSVFTQITNKVSDVKSWLSSRFTEIKNAITQRWSDAWNAIKKKVIDFFIWHVKKITDSWNWLKTQFTNLKNAITKTWSDAWNAIYSKLKSIWTSISKKVSDAWAWLRARFTDVKNAITKTWSDAWGAIYSKLSSTWTTISRKVSDAFSSLRGKFTDVKNGITKIWSDAWGAVRSKTTDIVGKVLSKVGEFRDKVKTAFNTAKNGISEAWDKVKGVVKAPVNYVIDPIYKSGIKGLWDKVAGFVGLGKLPSIKKLAAGGTVGPAPGIYNRPTAIVGEGRSQYPEFVIPTDPKYRRRALGLYEQAGTQLMDSGGIIGDIIGGAKNIGGKIGGVASDVGGWIKKKAGDLAAGALEPFFKAGMKVVNGMIKHIPGMNTGMGKMIAAMPKTIGNGIISWLKGKDSEASGGGDVAAALKWARTQAGKPYQWGGAGNPSWDCSGFMGGIQKKIDGKNPNGRIWSTFSFSGSRAPSGWVRHLKSPFMIGVTNKGKGHTAGTLGGVNVESSGGYGVRVGGGARGYNNSLFTDWYGYKPAKSSGGDWSAKGTGVARWRPNVVQELKHLGQSTGWQDTVLRRMNQESGGDPNVVNKWDSNWRAGHPSVGLMQVIRGTFGAYAGSHKKTGPFKYGVSVQPNANIHAGLNYAKHRYGSLSALNRPGGYDDGGLLQPGATLAFNKTNKPERVLTDEQWEKITGSRTFEVHIHAETLTGELSKSQRLKIGKEMRDIIRESERVYK